MSSAKQCVAQAIETLNVVRGNQQQIILKEERQVAIEKLLLGQDVLAVLPTSYGESMILTVFANSCYKRSMRRTERHFDLHTSHTSPHQHNCRPGIRDAFIGYRCCRT